MSDGDKQHQGPLREFLPVFLLWSLFILTLGWTGVLSFWFAVVMVLAGIFTAVGLPQTRIWSSVGTWQWRGRARWAFALTSVILCVPPLVRRVACWNNMWIYGFEPLELGHVPSFCNVTATTEELFTKGYVFGPETPHWDAMREQCDCRLPDKGAEEGHCATPAGATDIPSFTVVTALVDVGRRGRSGCEYLKMLQSQLVRHYNLVAYVEAWAVPFVQNYREQLGLANMTKVHTLTQRSRMEFYHLLPSMRAATERNFWAHFFSGWASGVAQKSVPHYGWINHQKIDFMMQTVEENPFGSDYFVWIDAGAGHGVVSVGRHFCGCNLAIPDTVTLYHNAASEEDLFEQGKCKPGVPPNNRFLTRLSEHFHPNPNVGCEPLRDMTLPKYIESHWKYHHFDEVMGTFYGGSPAGLRRLFADYNRTLHELTEAGHVDADQAIFSLISSSRPSYLRWRSSNFHGTMYIC